MLPPPSIVPSTRRCHAPRSRSPCCGPPCFQPSHPARLQRRPRPAGPDSHSRRWRRLRCRPRDRARCHRTNFDSTCCSRCGSRWTRSALPPAHCRQSAGEGVAGHVAADQIEQEQAGVAIGQERVAWHARVLQRADDDAVGKRCCWRRCRRSGRATYITVFPVTALSADSLTRTPAEASPSTPPSPIRRIVRLHTARSQEELRHGHHLAMDHLQNQAAPRHMQQELLFTVAKVRQRICL